MPQPVLEIVGPSGSKSLSLEDLKKLDVIQGEAGFKSSTGKITPPLPHRGVSLLALAELLGPLDPGMGVNAVAKDGYAITFSYDQLANGTFTAYDPATGEELKSPGSLTAMLAFERDGQPLPEDSDGTLRVVIISPKRDQVTDGHWSVKWVNKLEVKPLVADWTLALNGGIQAEIDRATFESCVGCHKATWTDDKAQVWTGVPLWLMMGYADDEVKHQGPAFNEGLAKAGYKVEVVAKDGYKVSLDSVPLVRQNDVLVASLVNDNPLPEQYFPLRLVGASLKKNEMVGAISEIALKVEGAAATTAQPTQAPEPTAAPTQGLSISRGRSWRFSGCRCGGEAAGPQRSRPAGNGGGQDHRGASEVGRSGVRGGTPERLAGACRACRQRRQDRLHSRGRLFSRGRARRRAGLRRLHGGFHRHTRQAQAGHAWSVEQPVGQGCRPDRAEVSTT